MTTMVERRKATDKKIYNAAVREFGENGFSNTTLSNIAKKAGITPGLIVQNFGSKEDLYRKIAIDIVTLSKEQLNPYSSSWEERCRAAIRLIIDALEKDPDFIYSLNFYVGLITSLDTPDDVMKELMDIYQGSPVKELVIEGQKKGELIEGDPYLVHALFWSNMQNIICYCFNHKLDYPPTEWFLDIVRKH